MNNNKNITKGNKRKGVYVKKPDKRKLYGETRNVQSEDEPKFRQQTCTTDKYNDASWYAVNPQLLKDAASFSYNAPLGSPFRADRLLEGPGNYWTFANNSATVPGLMSIHLVPTPGLATDSNSPVNIAAQNIYSFVRYMNSGAANYDAPDLMMYLLAMNSVYSSWNWIKRIYGCVTQFSQLNKYMPRAYLIANGVDPDDVMANLADLRAYLNMSAAKISAFCVPAVMSFFVRPSWLYSNIYKDSDTDKAQQYIFVPALFYQYDETSSPSGGILKPILVTPVASTTNLLKVSDLRNLLDGMIDALSYSEDIGIMSGDIKKAYGDAKLFTLSPVTPDYVVQPVYVEEVLNQIHNLTIASLDTTSTANLSKLNITQDPNTNWIKWNPTFTTIGLAPRNGLILNMPWQEITPENSMVGSRLASALVSVAGGNRFQTVGSEFVEAIYMWNYISNGSGRGQAANFTNLELNPLKLEQDIFFSSNGTWPAGYNLETQLYKLQMISNFDWHPLVSISYRKMQSTPAAGDYVFLGFLGDINNYTIISVESFTRMNETAMMSLFGVPQFGGKF